MKRINNMFIRNNIIGESDAFRKFRFQFLQLFNSDEIPRNDDEFESLYVNDKSFEGALYDFISIPNNSTTCIVGYTGIGKSTTIRHCFSIGVQKSSFIKNGVLVIPTFLDGLQPTNKVEFDITDRIAAACTMLKETYPDLIQLMKQNSGKEALYSFIRRHTERALEGTDSVDEFDWDQETYINEKLKAARSHFPYQYFANQLKFFISLHYSDIHELVIILDDMESQSDEFQEKAVEAFLAFYECMKNTDYPTTGDYSVKLLLSMRPHTYRRHIANRRIESYANNMPIVKMQSVPLNELFVKRFNYYTKRSNRDNGELDSWYACKRALDRMNDQFDGQYMSMISRLCFYNVRKSLSRYSMLFANRYWIQNNKLREAAFTVQEQNFDFDIVNVIRALGCQEEKVFFDNPDGLIRNIFYNSSTVDDSALSLMIIRYFYKKTKYEYYGVDEHTETVYDVMQFWQSLCGKGILERVKRIVDFLFEIKVLRKSIRTAEGYIDSNNDDLLLDNSILYISPLGGELYEMLSRNSVLFEMLREASWRDDSTYQFDMHSSSELMETRSRDVIYDDLLEYIDYLCEQEDDVLSQIKERGTQSQYAFLFGNESVCHVLWEGVNRSIISTRVKDNNPKLKSKAERIERKTIMLMAGF